MAYARGGRRDRTFRAVFTQPHEVQPATPLRTLLSQDQIWAGPGQVPDYDWQLAPRGRSPGVVTNRTAFAGVIPNLIGQDQVYGGAGQVPDYDWTGMGTPIANPVLRAWKARRAWQLDYPIPVEETNPSSDKRALGNPIAAQMNTTFTNDLSADGFTWAQGAPSFDDKYGNPICLVQRNNSGTKQHNFTYSNTAGASWTDAGIAETAIDRGACAYDGGHDLIHVGYNGQDVSDGIFYRRYLISYTAGTTQISGIARLDGVSVILDNQQSGETVQYRHPSAIFCEDVTLSGEATTGNTLVIVYGISNTNIANPGYEVRAVARALTYDANDGTAGNWRSISSSGGAPSGSTSLIGNTPVTGSYRRITGATSDTSTPCPSIGRVPFEGTTKGGILAYWGRPTSIGRAFLTYIRSGSAAGWSVGSSTQLDPMAIAGTDAGYSLKHQLLSKVTFDATNQRHYLAYPVWKSDALGDTWRVCAFDSQTLSRQATLDIYSAGGSNTDAGQDMFVAGDVQWDDVSGALVVAYGDLPRHDVYVVTMDKSLNLIGAPPLAVQAAFTTAPCDIPTIHPARVGGKTALVFRDFNAGARTNPPTYTPPYLGWWLTLDWTYPAPQETTVYLLPSAQRIAQGRRAALGDVPLNLQVIQPAAPSTLPDGTSFWLPNPPRGLRLSVASVAQDALEHGGYILVGQDQIHGGPGLVPDYDWPNPNRGRPPGAVTNRDLSETLALSTLLGQDVLYGAPGEVPVYENPLWPRGRTAGPIANRDWSANLQQTTLFVAPGVPLLPLDWPNPLRREPSRETRTWLQTYLPELLGHDAVYGADGQVPAYDWTGVPKGRAPGPLANRAHLVNLVLTTLVGQDRIYRGPGQVPPYEWVVPRGPAMRRLLYLLALSSCPGLIARVTAPPDSAWRTLSAPARATLIAPARATLTAPSRTQTLEVQ